MICLKLRIYYNNLFNFQDLRIMYCDLYLNGLATHFIYSLLRIYENVINGVLYKMYEASSFIAIDD